jgi:hypothetical protein
MQVNGLEVDRWRGQHFGNIGRGYFEVNEYARDCILGAAGGGSGKLLTAKIAKCAKRKPHFPREEVGV